MSISEFRRYPEQYHQPNQRRASLFTQSPFRSPSSSNSQERGDSSTAELRVAPAGVDQRSIPLLRPTPTMTIPQPQQRPPLRDPFPFTSPSHPISHSGPSQHSHSPSPHHIHPMARHVSYPSDHPLTTSPTDPSRPRPPPLRTAQSAYMPRAVARPSSPTENSSEGIEQGHEVGKRNSGDAGDEELTTKGRKRKRLAKACSACHKNKRRCDGFAPCSNCEFSSRPCLYLNALGETIPPPRTRDSFGTQGGSGTSTPGAGGRGPLGGNMVSQTGSGQGPQGQVVSSGPGGRIIGSDEGRSVFSEDGRYDAAESRGRGSRVDPLVIPVERKKTVSEVIEDDPTLSAELIDNFFRVSAPFCTMLHPPTFHHRLYLSQTSPILLDAIYAFSARSSTSPALLACYPPDHPPWLRGEGFAERAHAQAERTVTNGKAGSEAGVRRKGGPWEELEEIQAYTLLSVYFACLRQPHLASFYLDLAISMLRPTFSSSQHKDANLSPTEQATLAESRTRTFWLIVLHDLCAAANGRARMLKDSELDGVALPGDETLWVQFGGARSYRHTVDAGWKRRDGLALGSGNWLGEDGQVGELGHVLRILSIFSNIMAIANGTEAAADVRSAPLNQYQDALKSWAQNLPPHLRFDEHNLTASVARLQSPLPHIAFSGWAFGYMHAIAECGMFYLQAAVAQQPGASWTAQRQSQAVDNIAVVLDAMGERGREGPLMIFPIAVVSNWQDHVRNVTPAPTSQQVHLDVRLSQWWAEAKQQWGAERGQAIIGGHPPSATFASSEDAYRRDMRRDPPAYDDRTGSWSQNYSSNGRYIDHHYDSAYPPDRPPIHPDSGYDPRTSNANNIRHDSAHPSADLHRPHYQANLAPVPIGGSSANSMGGSALEHYSFTSTSPRVIMTNAAIREGIVSGSSEAYSPHLASRFGRHSEPFAQYPPPPHNHRSPPDLASSVSTSTSQLLPTPYSIRPNLPPIPIYGGRPRAISSVIPYPIDCEPSVSSLSLNADRRQPTSMSFSHSYDARHSESSIPSGDAKSYFLPPSAELRKLRQLDEVPRAGGSGPSSGLGLGLGGVVKGWKQYPFSPAMPEGRESGNKCENKNEPQGAKGPAGSGEGGPNLAVEGEPLGIAALISAAESEREKEEEKRRESEGSAAGAGSSRKEGAGVTGGEKEDVVMMDEGHATEAAPTPQAVLA